MRVVHNRQKKILSSKRRLEKSTSSDEAKATAGAFESLVTSKSNDAAPFSPSPREGLHGPPFNFKFFGRRGKPNRLDPRRRRLSTIAGPGRRRRRRLRDVHFGKDSSSKLAIFWLFF